VCMSLSKVFESVKCRISGLVNSGIAARSSNIFRVFLFDYTHPFHNNSCYQVSSAHNPYPYVKFRPLTIDSQSICGCVLLRILFPVESQLYWPDSHRLIQHKTAYIEPL